MNMLGKAIEIAVSAHAGQVDKGGKPYILHPLWVMNQVRHLGEDYMIVAVLHDVLEDSDWTKRMLIDEGFDMAIIIAIDILTHKQESNYEKYIQMIFHNQYAKAIKLKDLEHNSRITRIKGLRQKDFDRIAKYHKAYIYLKEN